MIVSEISANLGLEVLAYRCHPLSSRIVGYGVGVYFKVPGGEMYSAMYFPQWCGVY